MVEAESPTAENQPSEPTLEQLWARQAFNVVNSTFSPLQLTSEDDGFGDISKWWYSLGERAGTYQVLLVDTAGFNRYIAATDDSQSQVEVYPGLPGLAVLSSSSILNPNTDQLDNISIPIPMTGFEAYVMSQVAKHGGVLNIARHIEASRDVSEAYLPGGQLAEPEAWVGLYQSILDRIKKMYDWEGDSSLNGNGSLRAPRLMLGDFVAMAKGVNPELPYRSAYNAERGFDIASQNPEIDTDIFASKQRYISKVRITGGRPVPDPKKFGRDLKSQVQALGLTAHPINNFGYELHESSKRYEFWMEDHQRRVSASQDWFNYLAEQNLLTTTREWIGIAEISTRILRVEELNLADIRDSSQTPEALWPENFELFRFLLDNDSEAVGLFFEPGNAGIFKRILNSKDWILSLDKYLADTGQSVDRVLNRRINFINKLLKASEWPEEYRIWIETNEDGTFYKFGERSI